MLNIDIIGNLAISQIDNKQKKNMLRINSNTKIIPRIEGQISNLGLTFGERESLVKVDIECYVLADQLYDLDDAHEVVFQLKMPNHRRVNNSNIYCGSGEVILSKDDIDRLSKYILEI